MNAPATSVIDETRHARLLEDIDHVCLVAGIPTALVKQSAVGVCSPIELEWMKNFRLHQAHARSLLLTGNHTPSAETKMMLMTAAFLRNFIDARVMSVNNVLDTIADGGKIEATVLLIPNFHVDVVAGRQFPAHRVQLLYDLLLARVAQARMNVLYVSNVQSMVTQYGQPFLDHVQNYVKSEGTAA